MLTSKLIKSSWCRCQKRYTSTGPAVLKKEYEEYEIAKIRNIGILAHIDAGKTTTTERMLYYSGLIKHMGEVHHGNTVTDYMDQERQRGITITSAAVTFSWKNHRINLIDTPGHIDFTMEVEHTLKVLDGAVVILDGSAGVEAQTLTVCRQADKYDIPRIIYVNKMDRQDANFDMCLKSIQSKLNTKVFPVQFPIKEKGVLEGIVDVITLEKFIFDKKDMGMKFTKLKLSENEDKSLWEIANEKRRNLTDKLSSTDDKLAEIIIEQESLDMVTPQMLVNSLYRATIQRKGVPVLLGSSYKNIGVQPLMDSILLYLPSPKDSKYSSYYNFFSKNVCARAFKITHDKQKGPITFFRLYSGNFQKGMKVYNTHKEKKEVIGKLYIAYADEYQEVPSITYGNIAAVAGLNYTMAGDLITSSDTVMERVKDKLKAQKNVKSEDIEKIFDCNTRPLEPVFFCSIEAPSLSTQAILETALQQLVREDPSLRVTQNEETGQIVLSGMGELHLEIINERIRSEYKVEAALGPLQISYRETIKDPIQDTFSADYKIGNTSQKVTMIMSLIPNYQGNESLLIDRSLDHRVNKDAVPWKIIKVIKASAKLTFLHGPKLGYPVVNVGAKLHSLECAVNITPPLIGAAASQCIRQLMRKAGIILMEPIMRLEIVTPSDHLSIILKDLSKRRAEIQYIDDRNQYKIIQCVAPLAELLGYSKEIRIISSGLATFTVEFDHYQLMDSLVEAEAIKQITGFS